MVALSDGERMMLKESVLLPILLTVLERDKKAIQESSIKIKEAYYYTIEQAMERVHTDLVVARNFLRDQGIKVYKEERIPNGVAIKYVYRGYHFSEKYLSYFLRAEIETRLKKYLGLNNVEKKDD